MADNWTFVGVIDTDGFHTAELREMKGKDSQQVLLFADDFSIGVSTGPTPSTRPECDIQMSQLIYIDGEEVIANVLRIANPTPDPLSLELKIWLGLAGTTLPVLNLGADGSLVLPAGFDVDLDPVSLFIVDPGLPLGTHEFSCRMLDPVTGRLLREDRNFFEVQ